MMTSSFKIWNQKHRPVGKGSDHPRDGRDCLTDSIKMGAPLRVPLVPAMASRVRNETLKEGTMDTTKNRGLGILTQSVSACKATFAWLAGRVGKLGVNNPWLAIGEALFWMVQNSKTRTLVGETVIKTGTPTSAVVDWLWACFLETRPLWELPVTPFWGDHQPRHPQGVPTEGEFLAFSRAPFAALLAARAQEYGKLMESGTPWAEIPREVLPNKLYPTQLGTVVSLLQAVMGVPAGKHMLESYGFEQPQELDPEMAREFLLESGDSFDPKLDGSADGGSFDPHSDAMRALDARARETSAAAERRKQDLLEAKADKAKADKAKADKAKADKAKAKAKPRIVITDDDLASNGQIMPEGCGRANGTPYFHADEA